MSGNVIPWRPAGPGVVTEDLIYFRKDSVRIGTKVRYWGRTNPGLLYVVTGITSWVRESGYFYERSVVSARKLDDILTITPVDKRKANQTRSLNFSYMSQSALWRIELD